VSVLRAQARALFGTLPSVVPPKTLPITDERVLLGRTLYHDARLSNNQDLSCASCHALDGFGVDTRAEAVQHGTSFGHKKQFGDRNAPSVFNAALHAAQFWDGRAADLEAQAKGPVLNPVEMAMPDEASVVKTLKSIPGYGALFAAAFPEQADAITYDNAAIAIGAFERKLMTPAPLDQWLAGDDTALTGLQRKGLSTFISRGCIACHNGPGLGGGTYQKLGLIKPYPTKDEGRFAVTHQEADRFFFKVPSLRNVTKTGPYFHDGSIKTVDQAVRVMFEFQTAVGKLADEDLAAVVSFLDALTGVPAAELVEKPAMPPSGDDTPAPDPS
jgi:cytochrome c peroxidase